MATLNNPLKYLGLGIGDLYWWGDDVLGMRVDIDFSAFYTGSDVEAFKAAVPMESQHAPEPATMILLASGGLFMLKRRLRSRRLQKS